MPIAPLSSPAPLTPSQVLSSTSISPIAASTPGHPPASSSASLQHGANEHSSSPGTSPYPSFRSNIPVQLTLSPSPWIELSTISSSPAPSTSSSDRQQHQSTKWAKHKWRMLDKSIKKYGDCIRGSNILRSKQQRAEPELDVDMEELELRAAALTLARQERQELA